MNAAGAPGLERLDAALAADIRMRRRTIGAAILARAARGTDVTVGAEILALTFLDRCADAMTTGDWPAFFAWIDGVSGKYAAQPVMLRVLRAGAAAAAGFARPDVPAAQRDFEVLDERIAAAVERPRAAPRTGAQALDEVDALLDRLMSQLTAFDGATADHSRAVAMWCARIGKRLGLPASEITLVTRAGLIHDIGKITTPPEILNAPYRLSDAEMTIMRLHAEAGAAIVAEIPPLERLAPAVRGHHERMDGRGYPDGRRGSEIPIAVRIVSVADSFNAMIGNRPYRLPMAPTCALEQLRQHAGTQFDPLVVAAMVDVMSDTR